MKSEKAHGWLFGASPYVLCGAEVLAYLVAKFSTVEWMRVAGWICVFAVLIVMFVTMVVWGARAIQAVDDD